jgi:hypothetical protein
MRLRLDDALRLAEQRVDEQAHLLEQRSELRWSADRP